MSSPNVVAQMENVTFSYDTQATAESALLRQVSLSLAPGEIVGLIGPPASGKSSILKLLAGLVSANAGTVRVMGEEMGRLNESERFSLRRHIGMVFQNNALFDSMTVTDNVAFPLRMRGVGESEIADAVTARLADVGLQHAAMKFPNQISGGMKKRVSVARATITRPPLCFYDEPTAGLDPVTAAKIYALIRRFAEADGAAALIISNELDTLLPACQRVMMLYQGQVIFSGPPSELPRSSHRAVQQFVGGLDEGPL